MLSGTDWDLLVELPLPQAPQPVIASGEQWQHGGETSKWEDMTAGETNSFNSWAGGAQMPSSRWVVGPTAAASLPVPFQASQDLVTVQWHELSFMGSQWVSGRTTVLRTYM
jgi:hypothetical protein